MTDVIMLYTSVILPVFGVRPAATVDCQGTKVSLSQKWFVCYKGWTLVIYIAA